MAKTGEKFSLNNFWRWVNVSRIGSLHTVFVIRISKSFVFRENFGLVESVTFLNHQHLSTQCLIDTVYNSHLVWIFELVLQNHSTCKGKKIWNLLMNETESIVHIYRWKYRNWKSECCSSLDENIIHRSYRWRSSIKFSKLSNGIDFRHF